MSTVYLIGGAPRVGKTQLAQRCIEVKPMLAASTDALRHMLWHVISPADSPGLFALQHKEAVGEQELRDFIVQQTGQFIELYRAEAEAAWPSIQTYIDHNMTRGLPLLLEGFGILPAHAAKTAYDVRAVFLGNQSDTHRDVVLRSARSSTHSWMHKLSDETIDAYCRCYQQFSRELEAEANRYGFPYIEVQDSSFDQSIAEAREALFPRAAITTSP